MELQRRHSSKIVPGPMSENTLQVWRALPKEIRHDPTMVSFQMENERMHGATMFPEKESTFTEDTNITEDTEFITMKKPDESTKMFSASNETSTQQTNRATNEDHKARHSMYKRVGLLAFWLFCVCVLMTTSEKHLMQKTVVVPNNRTKQYLLPSNPKGNFNIKLRGAFDTLYSNETENYLTVQPQIKFFDEKSQNMHLENYLQAWTLPLTSTAQSFELSNVVYRNMTFELPKELLKLLDLQGACMYLSMYTNADQDLTVEITYNSLIIDYKFGTLLAACLLAVYYSMLVLEIFHRTFAAIVCSICSITILACFNDRPHMQEIVQWIDMELLTLVFCMMIIVGILMETGVFDYLSVVAFEISHGKIWPMIYSICAITCLVSSFLDNMTTVLLMTPVAIRLCEVMNLDPVPVILGTIVHANIGGTLTLFHGEPNFKICNEIIFSGHHFFEFHQSHSARSSARCHTESLLYAFCVS